MKAFEEIVRGLLASGNHVRFRVSGDSMYPTIRSGDSVEVAPCEATGLRRGDVVLAVTARGLTLHRIARISNRIIEMRGDNAPARDEPIRHDCILGRAVDEPPLKNGWILRRGSMKIIRFVRAFLHRVLAGFSQQPQR